MESAIKPRPSARSTTPELQVFKWSLMASTTLWAIVYKLSEAGLKVPDFVYVNF